MIRSRSLAPFTRLGLIGAVLLSLAAPVATYAASTTPDEMSETQLQEGVEQILTDHRIDTEVGSLTRQQLETIYLMGQRDDTSNQQIQTVIQEN